MLACELENKSELKQIRAIKIVLIKNSLKIDNFWFIFESLLIVKKLDYCRKNKTLKSVFGILGMAFRALDGHFRPYYQLCLKVIKEWGG